MIIGYVSSLALSFAGVKLLVEGVKLAAVPGKWGIIGEPMGPLGGFRPAGSGPSVKRRRKAVRPSLLRARRMEAP